jgi:hypothetical protein
MVPAEYSLEGKQMNKFALAAIPVGLMSSTIGLIAALPAQAQQLDPTKVLRSVPRRT